MSFPHSVSAQGGPASSPGPSLPSVSRQGLRSARFAAQRVLWDESSLPRVRKCGRVSVSGDSLVSVRATGAGAERRAGFGGLHTCGSVWACPVCASKIQGKRREEVATALGGWCGAVGMVTLTMRHRQGQSLAALWSGVSRAWGRVTSGRWWKDAQAHYGIEGWLRVVEVTHGKNGWHVHVHAAVLLPVGTGSDELDALGVDMFARWSSALVSSGFAAPLLRSGGMDARLIYGAEVLGDYFTKTQYTPAESAAGELAGGGTKSGRGGNRTPFEILADLYTHGDAEDLDLWHEWEAGSKGRRQLTWSRGLRERLLTEPELTDQELAEVDEGGEDLLFFESATWREARWHRAALADAAERDQSGQALRQLCRELGLAFLLKREAAAA